MLTAQQIDDVFDQLMLKGSRPDAYRRDLLTTICNQAKSAAPAQPVDGLVERLREEAEFHCVGTHQGFSETDVAEERALMALLNEAAAALERPAGEGEMVAVAIYAGVDISRYTIEWLIEPDTSGMQPWEAVRTLAYKDRLPIGTKLYAHPSRSGGEG